jgi:hypothetical protein
LNSGCASLVAKTPATVLLQDEKIYTVTAGQEISVELDHKPTKLTFPYPMKLMSIDNAVRIEQNLNDKTLKDIKASSDRKKIIGIVGSIFTAIAFGFGIAFKKKWWPNKITTMVETK